MTGKNSVTGQFQLLLIIHFFLLLYFGLICHLNSTLRMARFLVEANRQTNETKHKDTRKLGLYLTVETLNIIRERHVRCRGGVVASKLVCSTLALTSEWSKFETWLGILCCILGQDTFN